MTKILSIETSGTVCSIALHDHTRLLSSQNLHIEKSHSAHLVPGIKGLLKFTGVDLKELDAIAISAGPGSYTGLRIGMSSAKGLCYTLDKPLIAINTLEAMAFGMSSSNFLGGWLCPLIDARRMEVYALMVDEKLNIIEPTNAKIIDENSFKTQLEEHDIIFFGSGAIKCRELIRSDNAHFIPNFNSNAEYVGFLALQKYENKEFESLAYYEPFYLKDVQVTKPNPK